MWKSKTRISFQGTIVNTNHNANINPFYWKTIHKRTQTHSVKLSPKNHLLASNLTLSSTNNATNMTTDEIRPKMIWPQSPKSPTDQQKLTSTSVLSALSKYWRETLKTNGCPLQMLCRGLSPPTATLAPVSPCGDDAQRT